MNDRITMSAPPRPGFALFCDSHDTVRANHAHTLRMLTRSAAVRAYPCALGQNGHRANIDDLKALRDLCAEHDIAVRPFFFAPLSRPLDDFRAWYAIVRAELGSGMLDAESEGDRHWPQQLFARAIADDPDMWITTTEAEAPHLGSHNRRMLAQFERQASVALLARKLGVFRRYSLPENIVPVTGLFDEKDDPRTIDEVEHDLTACTRQALISGELASWQAHTMSDEEADGVRGWTLETWAPPRAA